MLEDLEQLNPVDNGKAMTVQAHQEDEPMIGGTFSLPMTFFSTLDVAPGWDYADRDAWLRVFWKKFGGDLLQAVLATSVAKVQTQNFTFEGPEKMATFYHDAFVPEADFGKGYGYMIARGVIDYYTQDNGWFLERHRSGPNDNDGPCLGLAHLDSHRMKPTGNAETPWAYLDVDGTYHLMHKSQFIRIVDMPTPEVEKHGWERGFCALSRALSTAMVMTMLVAMKREKLADLPPSALGVFNNISRKQFESALDLHSLQEEAKGNQVWRSLLPLFGIDPAHPAGVDFISLREVWEGFDELTAYNVAAYSIAAAWRMDPREFWPVSQGPLGTGKEAEVQHQKAKAKSTGLLFTEIERAFNSKYTLPRELTFKYALQDSDEEEQQARIHQMQITNVKAMQEAGAELNAEEVRYLLSSQYKILPKGMEKPVAEGEAFGMAADTVVWMDDVDRQTKEFWGPSVIIDQNGKVIRLEKGFRSVSVPFGLKGSATSGNWGHSGRPGKRGGSAPKGGRGFIGDSTLDVAITSIIPDLKQLNQERRERLYVFDGKGNLQWDSGDSGGAHNVEDFWVDGDSRLLVHNHPIPKTFTGDDIATFLSEDGVEHSVIYTGKDTIHRISKRADTPRVDDARAKLSQRTAVIYDEESSKLEDAWLNDVISERMYDFLSGVNTMSRLADEFGFDFGYEILPGSSLKSFELAEKQRYLIPPTIPQERGGGGFGRYAKSMRDNVRGLWMEELGFVDFLDSMFLTITSGLTRAFNEGLKKCDPPASEMTAEAKAVLDSIIANEVQWSGKFGDFILDNTRASGGKLAPLLQRAEMWALTYPETTNTALLYCPDNPNLIWKYGATKEHCTDALKLHGKVYKAAIWRKFGVVPQSSDLECGGWRCACSLTPTDEKAIPGRPPKLTGQKELAWWRIFEKEIQDEEITS